MSPQSLATLLTILGLFVAAIPTYFLARSNARENERRIQDRVDRAVQEATGPLRDQLATTNANLLRREREAEQKNRRITELEDKLYGRGRT